MLLLAFACMPPKSAQLAQLAEQGAPDLACTLEEGAHHALAERWLLAESTVVVSTDVVPREAFAHPPQGYGSTWWLINVGVEQRGPIDRVELDLRLPGYELFAAQPDFLARHYPRPADDTRAEPDLEGDTRSDWGDLWQAVKVVGSLMVLPLTGTWDGMMLLADLEDGKVDGGVPYLTPHLALFAFDTPKVGPLRLPSFGTLTPTPAGLACERDLCTTQLVVKPGGTRETRLTATLHAGDCHFAREAVLPEAEGELEAVLAGLLPPEGVQLQWEAP